jgi:hypothetical protein
VSVRARQSPCLETSLRRIRRGGFPRNHTDQLLTA